jgi:hypothetical protein
VVTVALIASLLALVVAGVWVFRFWSRWRAMRYCWYMMSDFAASLVFKDSGDEFDHRWRDLLEEHKRLMRQFGTSPMREPDVRRFEAFLAKEGIPLLTEHRR